ncbi:MAG: ATP-binding protein [Planctomycetes bacterium]|nr:ATP-binding protein [Planctomycetota bacterium]
MDIASPKTVLHPRALVPLLRARLTHRPVVVLTGARQTGKTTLVRDLLPSAGATKPVYLTLDDPDERLRLAADPVRRLDYGDRLVILDEVQKAPALLDAVKLLADRRAGHRFLLLGSSHILLLDRVRETLAGRAALLELWPMALIEAATGDVVPECALDAVWRDGAAALPRLASADPPADSARAWRSRCEDQLRWGGYPGLEGLPEAERPAWFRDYRRTYLERDLADLGRVSDLDQFALAQTLFAARTAQLLSLSDVARDLGVAVNTVKRYVRLLELSYQLCLLRPFLPNLTTRLVKSPKVYWTDPGLARILTERPSLGDGALYETFVCGQLLRWRGWQPDPPGLFFFRTQAGREVDFVLAQGRRCLAIEVKAATKVSGADASGLRDFLKDRGTSHDSPGVGIVVYRGREISELAPRVWAVPDWRLFGPVGEAKEE